MIDPNPDTAGSYQRRALQHRPSSPDAIAAEIQRLRNIGLTPHDIAASMGMAVEAVRQILGYSNTQQFTR